MKLSTPPRFPPGWLTHPATHSCRQNLHRSSMPCSFPCRRPGDEPVRPYEERRRMRSRSPVRSSRRRSYSRSRSPVRRSRRRSYSRSPTPPPRRSRRRSYSRSPTPPPRSSRRSPSAFPRTCSHLHLVSSLAADCRRLFLNETSRRACIRPMLKAGASCGSSCRLSHAGGR